MPANRVRLLTLSMVGLLLAMMVAAFSSTMAFAAEDTFIPLGQEGAPAGAAADPFVISTEADLIAFATSVNGAAVVDGAWVQSEGGAHSYAGMTVVLARDITLTSAFTPIGTGMNSTYGANSPVTFNGIFDGKGHTISGLSITAASNPKIANAVHEAAWYSALFGAISDASILNTTVILSDSATFTVETTSAEASAGLVAQVYGGENIISCCGVVGDIGGGASHVAGIVGRVDAGSLVMSYCYHRGTVTTKSTGGGLIGALNNTTATLISCYQDGAVASTSTSAYAANFYGQLAASGSRLTLTSCVASEAGALCGANMTNTATGCVSGVADWSSDNVKAALGTEHFAYSSDAGVAPGIGAGDVASYAVTFVKDSAVKGSVPTMGKQKAGTEVTIPTSSLTRTGYVFAGWRVAGAGEEGVLYQAGDTFEMPAAAIVFEAQWAEEASRLVKIAPTPSTATVSLVDADTKVAVNPVTSEVEGQTWFRVNPLLAYTLTVSATGYETQTINITAGEADAEQAVELVPTTHAITYTLFGGAWAEGFTAPATFTELAATALPTAENLTKDGFLFMGWKTSVDATDYVTEIPAGTTEDVTLVAWWQVEPEPPATVSPNTLSPKSEYYRMTYTGELAEGEIPLYKGEALFWNGKAYVALVTKAAADALSYRDFTTMAGEKTEIVLGDSNGNGRVNIVDAQVAYDAACGKHVGFSKLSMQCWIAADFNGDGELDAVDAFAIQNYVMTKK